MNPGTPSPFLTGGVWACAKSTKKGLFSNIKRFFIRGFLYNQNSRWKNFQNKCHKLKTSRKQDHFHLSLTTTTDWLSRPPRPNGTNDAGSVVFSGVMVHHFHSTFKASYENNSQTNQFATSQQSVKEGQEIPFRQ